MKERYGFMNKEELHNLIEKQQPNICQIVAIRDNEIVYISGFVIQKD